MRKIVDYGSIGCDAHGTVKEKRATPVIGIDSFR